MENDLTYTTERGLPHPRPDADGETPEARHRWASTGGCAGSI